MCYDMIYEVSRASKGAEAEGPWILDAYCVCGGGGNRTHFASETEAAAAKEAAQASHEAYMAAWRAMLDQSARDSAREATKGWWILPMVVLCTVLLLFFVL